MIIPSDSNISEFATIYAFSGVVIPAINIQGTDASEEETGSGEEIPQQNIPNVKSTTISSAQSNPVNAESDVRANNSISAAEIPETVSGTRSLPAEPFTEKSVMGLSNSMAPPVPEQKIPALRDSRPFTRRTLYNIPLSDEPLRRAIGSGTDTSIFRESRKVSKSPGDRRGNCREMAHQTKMDNPPDNGFISRIISAIFGLFSQKRK